MKELQSTTESIPERVQEQFEFLINNAGTLTEAYYRLQCPDLIEWAYQRVSILDFVDGDTKQITPNVHLVRQGCPDCGGGFFVEVSK